MVGLMVGIRCSWAQRFQSKSSSQRIGIMQRPYSQNKKDNPQCHTRECATIMFLYHVHYR